VETLADALAQDTESPIVNACTAVEGGRIAGSHDPHAGGHREFSAPVQREQDDARKFESMRMVRDMLPGLDGLNRAITSAEQTGDMQTLLDGIKMVAQQFRDILKAHAPNRLMLWENHLIQICTKL
jgi:hypothetical protein